MTDVTSYRSWITKTINQIDAHERYQKGGGEGEVDPQMTFLVAKIESILIKTKTRQECQRME